MGEERGSRLLDEAAVLLAEISAKHRVLQDLQGGARHVLVDLLCAGASVFPAFEYGQAGSGEGRHIGEHVLGSEQRCGEPALPAPVLPFRVEQPSTDRLAEHIVIKWLLGVVIGAVEQDRLDQLEVHDEDGLKPEPPVDDDPLVVEILAPARHRIADHAQHQHGEGKTPLGRDGSLRYGRFRCYDPMLHDTIWPGLQGSCNGGCRSIKVL